MYDYNHMTSLKFHIGLKKFSIFFLSSSVITPSGARTILSLPFGAGLPSGREGDFVFSRHSSSLSLTGVLVVKQQAEIIHHTLHQAPQH